MRKFHSAKKSTIHNIIAISLHILSTVPALSASIDPPATTMAGDTLTLTCTVTVADWAKSSIGTVTLEWLDAGGTTLSASGDITLGSQTGSSPLFTSTLEFITLRTSYGGEYTCQAMSDVSLATASVDVIVQSEFMASYPSMILSVCHIATCF